MKKEKKVKRRKRLVINSNIEHTVIAKDYNCKDFIIQKATKHNIKIFTRGHVENRLYFQCNQKRWERFCKLITKKCVFDSPVNCPKWLQKKMLKNLREATYSRIDPVRAEIAKKLLETVERNANKVASQLPRKTEKTNAHTQTNGQLLKPALTVNLKRQKFMGNIFSKCVNSLRNFMSRKRCLQLTHS